jgi:hypothetical protein
MPRGTKLSQLLAMTKGEMMVDLDSTVSPGGDSIIKAAIANQQQWLATHYNWADLRIRPEFNLVPGQRYYDFPSLAPDVTLDLGQQIRVECYWSNLWYSTEPGIKLINYNTLNPELNMRLDPVIRWQKYRPDGAQVQLEVWPLPATATRLRVCGQKQLAPLVGDDDVAELDDLLLAQWTAAKLLTRLKHADAQGVLALAKDTLNRLLGGDNSPSQVFVMSGNPRGAQRHRDRSEVPTVAVNYTPNP